MVKVIVSGPQEMPVRLDSLVDFEDTLVSGELTSDGIGYSEEAGTEDAGVVITPFSRVINPLIEGEILWIQFDLTAGCRVVSFLLSTLPGSGRREIGENPPMVMMGGEAAFRFNTTLSTDLVCFAGTLIRLWGG